MKKLGIYVAVLLFCSSCFQYYSEEEDKDLCTTPATNNPLIVPKGGSPIPGLPR